MVVIDFSADREPFPCGAADLRRVLNTAFQQRRKMLRQSLKGLLAEGRQRQERRLQRQQEEGELKEVGAAVGAARFAPSAIGPDGSDPSSRGPRDGGGARASRYRMPPAGVCCLGALPEAFAARRPEELAPEEFVELTLLVFGRREERRDGETRVWRHAKHGGW